MRKTEALLLIISNFFLIAFSLIFFFAVQVSAQNSTTSGQSSSITFPIAELGNCSSPQACHVYCEDPTHRDACLAFAQSHGLKPPNPNQNATPTILAAAKIELGCDSAQTCHDFCEQPTNKDTCLAFAQKHGLTTGSVLSPAQASILAKAKSFLGCDSVAVCKQFCSLPENKTKCTQFSQMVGLRGGEKISGPGGCNSYESCKAFCSQEVNRQTCLSFAKQGSLQKEGPSKPVGEQPNSTSNQFPGPGGCQGPDACYVYCKSHPDACANFHQPTPTTSQYIGPDRCSTMPGYHWTGTQCVPNTTEFDTTSPTPTPTRSGTY